MHALLEDLRALAPSDPLLVARAYYPDGQAYPGWSEHWERRLTAAPPDHEIDLARLGLLPAVERGLIFALARRGHLAARDRIVATEHLAFFSTAYARFGSWPGCRTSFAGVEQVWPAPVWHKAVVVAALSPSVERLGLHADELERLLSHVRDDDLFALLSKCTSSEVGLVTWLEARARVGTAGVWAALDACCTEAAARLTRGEITLVPDAARLAIEVAGRALREARAAIPTAWAPLVEALARGDEACVVPLLACMPEPEREAWVLSSIDEPPLSPRFSLLRAYPTPRALTQLGARALETTDGWRYRAPVVELLPGAVDILLAQLPPPSAFASFLLADVGRAFMVAEALLAAATPRVVSHLTVFLDLPTTPAPWARLAPWVARQWGRWPTPLLEESLGAGLAAPMATQEAQARWVEIIEAAARTNGARALAARWARELPARSPLQIRMAWVAAEEPAVLAAARREGDPLFAWAQAHTGEESPSYDLPDAEHPALAWAAVRWLGAEAPMTRLRRAAPPGLAAAAEAWIDHRIDLLEAGEAPPPWLEVQLGAALRAATDPTRVQRLLIAAGTTTLREALESVAVAWLQGRAEARAVLTGVIAARKSKKGRKVPTTALERALASALAHEERGRRRPAGASWATWGAVEEVEPAEGRAVTSIQRWDARRWVMRTGPAPRVEVLGEAERWLLDDDEAVSVREDGAPGVKISPGDGFHTLCALPGRRVLTLAAAHTMEHPVQVWSADTGAVLHRAPIDDMALAVLPAGPERVLIIGDGSVSLWQIAQKKALHWRTPQGVAFAALGSGRVAVGSEDQTLHFLQWSSDKWKHEAAYGDGWVTRGMVGSPDGRFLAQPDPDGVKVWAEGALTGWLTWPACNDPTDPVAEGWVEVVAEIAVVGRGRRVEAWALAERARCATWESPRDLTARATDADSVWLGDAGGAVWRLAMRSQKR